MSGEGFVVDRRLKEELTALDRLCAYIMKEAEVLEVPQAEELGAAVSKRISEILSALVRH